MIKKLLILAEIGVRIFPGLKKLTSLLSVTLFARRLKDAAGLSSRHAFLRELREVNNYDGNPPKTDSISSPNKIERLQLRFHS